MSPIKILICFNIPCNYAITFFPHDRYFKIHILPNKVTSYQNYGLFLERGQTSPCIVDGQDNEQSSPAKKKVSVSLVTLNAPYPTPFNSSLSQLHELPYFFHSIVVDNSKPFRKIPHCINAAVFDILEY